VALGTLPYINGGNKTAVPVSGTCSENGRTVSIGGAISGSATCAGGAFSLNLDYSAVTDGAVAVTADLSDTAGNSAAQAVGSLTKDTVPPTVTLGALPVINAANKSAVAVGGSCSEDGGTVNIGGAVSSSATCSGGAWSKTLNYSGASDGSVGITVDATDAAGNNAAQASGSFTKDTVQPTVSFNALPYINNANKASVPVSGSCSENGRTITIGGGVATTATCSAGAFSLSIDYSGLADGAVAITADLSDAAGNAATQASGSMTKDIVAPTVGLSSIYINSTNYTAAPLSGSCSENTLAVTIGGSRTGSTTCSSNLWSTTVDYSGVADGSVSVTADHQDAAGNGATQASATLTKDTVAPTATITNAPTGASRASVLDVTIGGVDVNDYRYRLFNGTGTCVGGTYSSWTTASTHIADNFSSLNDDTVKLCVQGRDVAGNAQGEASATVATWTKDTTPPTAPASFTATQGHRKLTLSWADGGGGTSGYVIARRTGAAVDWTPSGGDTYSVNDTVGSSTVVYVGTSTTYSDTGLTNGTTYYYSIFAYDSLKNYSSASTQSKAPQAPISETDLVLWLDASEISTLYQNSDCSTSPVTADSQTVGCWKGLAGSNINVSQATSGSRPTYLTSGLGASKAGLSFASKWLTGTLTGLTGNQNHTMIVVFKYSSLSSTNNVVLKIGTDGTSTKTSLESTSANFKDSFSSSAVLYRTLTNNSAYFATKTYNGSAGPHNRVSYLNGKVGPMAGTSGTISTLSLPSNPTVEVGGAASADYFSGVISEVIVYSRAVGYAELTSINTYLAAKWGFTDPGSCHGKSVGGYCWYQSMKNYSCNDVCAGISAYDSGTCSYGAANAANCQGIFDAIGAPGSGAPVSTTSYSGGGCLFYDAGKKDKDNSRKYNLTCNATYKHADIFRLCACTLP
jgi:hypothetical protein